MHKHTATTDATTLIAATKEAERSEHEAVEREYRQLLSKDARGDASTDADVKRLRSLLRQLGRTSGDLEADLAVVRRDVELTEGQTRVSEATEAWRAAHLEVIRQLNHQNEVVEKLNAARLQAMGALAAAKDLVERMDAQLREQRRLRQENAALFAPDELSALPASHLPDGLPAVPMQVSLHESRAPEAGVPTVVRNTPTRRGTLEMHG